jgi:hypothetical protein
MRNALPILTLRTEQGDQGQLRHADHDHERGERADGVHEVGCPEATATLERAPEAELLNERGGNGEPEQREPGNCRQHEQPDEERHGREDEQRK